MFRYCLVTAISMVLGTLCGTAPGAGEAESTKAALNDSEQTQGTWAGEREKKHKAAALAKAVAPFVDETTLAVFHGDVSRLEVAPFVSLAFELLPDFRSDSREARAKNIAEVKGLLAALARQGCNDVYVVVNFRLWEYPVMLIVPLPEGVDDAAVDSVVEKGSWLEAARLKGAFFAGEPRARRRLEQHRPAPRPELVAAFEAVGDTGGQMIFLPPKALEDLVRLTNHFHARMPEGLQRPTPELIRSIKWEAYGLNTSPKKSLTLVVQLADEQSASALEQLWNNNSRHVRQWAALRAILPNVDEVMSLFSPKLDGDRLVLSIDKPDQVDTLMDALERLVKGLDRLVEGLDQLLTPKGGADAASPKGADN